MLSDIINFNRERKATQTLLQACKLLNADTYENASEGTTSLYIDFMEEDKGTALYNDIIDALECLYSHNCIDRYGDLVYYTTDGENLIDIDGIELFATITIIVEG